ncbi:hypothetical protein Hanom_Chr02g00117421 [Helianthus anomalus]
MLSLIRLSNSASWESLIGCARDKRLFAPLQYFSGWSRSEAPITFSANGSPLHFSTIY